MEDSRKKKEYGDSADLARAAPANVVRRAPSSGSHGISRRMDWQEKDTPREFKSLHDRHQRTEKFAKPFPGEGG